METPAKETMPIGTCSHGTHRPQDLIPSFAEWVREYCDISDVAEFQDSLEYAEQMEEWEDDDRRWTMEEAGYVIEELVDILNVYVPAFCYFGPSEGDGADFGCWVCMDAVEEAVQDKYVVKKTEYPTEEEIQSLPDDKQGFLIVNDHGNATFLAVETKKIAKVVWRIV